MLTHEGLKKDVARRIEKIQAMMAARDVGALVVVGGGAPGSMGAIRYISNAHLWGGAGYVVLGAEDPEPWAEIWSSYQAVWTRNETTTNPLRVEAPDDPLDRVAQLARMYAEKNKRVGMVNMNKLMSLSEYGKFNKLMQGYELVEITGDYNAIRQIKSPSRLEAIQQQGAILDASMDVFAEHAFVGARYWDVCAAAEAFVKAKGAFWGRTKLSLDITPFTVPTPKDLTMREDDIINYEIVYESPWGYWLEMTSLFSFHPLPDDVRGLLEGYLAAVDASSEVARAGNTFRHISEANDQALRDVGTTWSANTRPIATRPAWTAATAPAPRASPTSCSSPTWSCRTIPARCSRTTGAS